MKKHRLLTVMICLSLLALIFLLLLLCNSNVISQTSDETTVETTMETTSAYAPVTDESHLDTFIDSESGRSMDYHIYFPENATEHMPLIVYLHGTGAIGKVEYNEQNPAITQTINAYGDEFPYILLAPSSMYNRSWKVGYIPALVKSLVDDTVERYNVDRDKIIIIGHSMGAGGVFRQVELYGDFYSAAIPVSIANIDNIDISACIDVPMWGFAGTEEAPHEYIMRKLFDKIAEAGGNVHFEVIPGAKHGDSADYAFTREVFEWALAQ